MAEFDSQVPPWPRPGRSLASREAIKQRDARQLVTAVQKNDQPEVERLLTQGVDKDAAGYEGITPLYMAAKMGHVDLLNRLLAAGADKNKADKQGITPLSIALQEGHLAAAEALLAAGANANMVDNRGSTPLCVAVQQNRLPGVDCLLAAEVCVGHRTKAGDTAIMLAHKQCNMPLAKQLAGVHRKQQQTHRRAFEKTLIDVRAGTVTIVSLNHQALGDSACARLARALLNNTSVTCVEMAGNNITDLGARWWAWCLMRNRTLETLNLDSNLIGREGLRSLRGVIKINPVIKKLNFGNNYVYRTLQWERPPSDAEQTPESVATAPALTNWQATQHFLAQGPLWYALWMAQLTQVAVTTFFGELVDKLTDFLLIHELSRYGSETLLIVACVFICLSYFVGIFGVCWARGWPESSRDWLEWCILLPVATPGLMELLCDSGELDHVFGLLKVLNFLLEDIPECAVALSYLLKTEGTWLLMAKFASSLFIAVRLYKQIRREPALFSRGSSQVLPIV